ncbi:MAG: hypothetical protein RLZZ11_850, partial [Cyanobacteriota bacterium]
MQDQMGTESACLEDRPKIPRLQNLKGLVLILEFMAGGIPPRGAKG